MEYLKCWCACAHEYVVVYSCNEYKNTPNSLYSILVVFIRNCKYSRSTNNSMKMQLVCACTSSRNLMIVSLIVYVLFSSIVLGSTESQGKQDYSEKSTQGGNNERHQTTSNERKAGNAIGIQGDQIIYCEGDLNSCHNVLTNIICSNVKYCIVGDITPFVMSNPL